MNKHKVEYLLIGGTLAIAYGIPRVTKDIDIFLHPTLENAERCLQALKELGMGTAALIDAKELTEQEITIFKDFVRLDVLTRVKGVDFESAWRKKVYLSLENVDIPALHIDDLIQTKEAAGRSQDLEDIKILQLAKAMSPEKKDKEDK